MKTPGGLLYDQLTKRLEFLVERYFGSASFERCLEMEVDCPLCEITGCSNCITQDRRLYPYSCLDRVRYARELLSFHQTNQHKLVRGLNKWLSAVKQQKEEVGRVETR